MKTSEITKEANKLIKDIFWHLIKTNNKDNWKVAIKFTQNRVAEYEVIRWEKSLFGEKY